MAKNPTANQTDRSTSERPIFNTDNTVSEKELKRGKAAKRAFVTSIINFVPWVPTIITAFGSSNGYYVPPIAIYYIFFGWLFIASIVWGIIGIRSRNKKMAIVSLLINIVPFIIVALLMVLTLKHE